MKNSFPTYKFTKFDMEYQILTDENQSKLAEYMLNNHLKKLIITSDKDGIGWNHSFLPDLTEFDFIEELLVYWTNIKNIKGIHSCKNVKVLWLDNDDKTELDFSLFPKIEKLVSWDRKGIDEIWAVKTIKDLTLAGLKSNYFKSGAALKTIERLRIIKTHLEDISFLAGCEQIVFLELLELSKMENLDGIGMLKNLKHLRIDANKVKDFSFIRFLKNLEKCYLSSKIGVFNVENFKDLKKIEKINLSGNQKVQEINRFLQKSYF
ncbi:leucine-rich repeat domain-containing protein [Pedobacter hiemivivus]|uniref:Leucine-rich repeat domain-containing protein n=1 Tax=Pedobacter hiemivivus TaxID=2530454 RepID=A0A4R0NJR5_9SPHI|nr:hypothetical protein [Pedobacter hiemivivus]TCC99682.1 hypothetical protein EZ444_03155 [Pedobacter hiemivivus]